MKFFILQLAKNKKIYYYVVELDLKRKTNTSYIYGGINHEAIRRFYTGAAY